MTNVDGTCDERLAAMKDAFIANVDNRLDFHAPVARYWPEFAAAGKEHVEVLAAYASLDAA
jgi:hypothetical protein